MLPQTLPKDKFDDFVRYLMNERRVFAPVAKGPKFAFELIEAEDISRIRMDYDITILPPKKCFFPTRETLLSFDGKAPGAVSAEIQAEPMVLLGVHPYDLHGLATTDKALCEAPLDPYYQARREASILIGLNINAYANEHQFMADMGTTEPPEGGFDLFMTDLGDRWFTEVGSRAGSELMKGSGLFTPAGPQDHQDRQAYDKTKGARLYKKLPYKAVYLPELLEASYDSLLWDAVARRCFSCGTCTTVCPTCYCFDVQDKLNVDAVSGVRRRQWDSCQLAPFAEVAGGENFRQERSSRLRHRVFRKGKFIPERTGQLGCVGCGRCSDHCVAKISILEAFQQIAAEAAEVEG